MSDPGIIEIKSGVSLEEEQMFKKIINQIYDSKVKITISHHIDSSKPVVEVVKTYVISNFGLNDIRYRVNYNPTSDNTFYTPYSECTDVAKKGKLTTVAVIMRCNISRPWVEENPVDISIEQFKESDDEMVERYEKKGILKKSQSQENLNKRNAVVVPELGIPIPPALPDDQLAAQMAVFGNVGNDSFKMNCPQCKMIINVMDGMINCPECDHPIFD